MANPRSHPSPYHSVIHMGNTEGNRLTPKEVALLKAKGFLVVDEDWANAPTTLPFKKVRAETSWDVDPFDG